MSNQITSLDKRARKKVFLINGGAGRIICALPAFEKYALKNGADSFYIFSQSGLDFFLGTEFQDIAFDPGHKGLFKDIIKPNDLVNLEPYQTHGYYNQEKSLTEAFDKLINETDDHKDLKRPKIVLQKTEEIRARNIILEVKKQQKKKHTVVIQPFGRNAESHEGGYVVDETSRSLSTDDYFYISEQLRKKYNVISMTEIRFDNDDNLYVDTNLRHWSSIIEQADYFVGIDSCGQHMAYAFNKPGSVILGSTFAENISYPKHFNIVEKPNQTKEYAPIRIDGLDGPLADRKNDTCMDFTEQELKDITKNILKDIAKKVEATKGTPKKKLLSVADGAYQIAPGGKMKLPEQHEADAQMNLQQKKLLERARGGKGFEEVFKNAPIDIPTNPITKETKV
tara:strand:+ start:1135 stop:2322 length:1188 start_codon:yes stop_codon:yes gene_type:complete